MVYFSQREIDITLSEIFLSEKEKVGFIINLIYLLSFPNQVSIMDEYVVFSEDKDKNDQDT
ncbi:MAG: hypothetical protein QXR30_03715 [Candidatus Woesearchaeota archaeon]